MGQFGLLFPWNFDKKGEVTFFFTNSSGHPAQTAARRKHIFDFGRFYIFLDISDPDWFISEMDTEGKLYNKVMYYIFSKV
jgi:hypothetical protein